MNVRCIVRQCDPLLQCHYKLIQRNSSGWWILKDITPKSGSWVLTWALHQNNPRAQPRRKIDGLEFKHVSVSMFCYMFVRLCVLLHVCVISTRLCENRHLATVDSLDAMNRNMRSAWTSGVVSASWIILDLFESISFCQLNVYSDVIIQIVSIGVLLAGHKYWS